MYKGKDESDDDFDLSKSASDDGSDMSEFDLDEEELEVEEDEEEIITSLEPEELQELEELQETIENPVEQVWDDFQAGLPPSYPFVEVVNLDRKMSSKLKRQEFEPLEKGKIMNISNSYNEDMEPLKISLTEDTWKSLEKEQLFSYLLHYGYYSKDQYSNVIENLDKSVDSLAKLRLISPDTPLLFLTCLYRLLIFWGHIKPSSVEPSVPSYFYNKSELLNFICYICSKDCSNYRYSSKTMNLIICPECFHLGIFPDSLNSKDFEGQTNGLDIDNTSADISWSEDDKYLMLKLISAGEEWESIADKLQKPVSECLFVFLTIGSISDNNSTTEMVKKIVGKSPNPVLQLATTVAKCVHPGLGSEIAKASLSQLISSHRASYDANFAAAVFGFEAAVKKAKEIAKFENQSISNMNSELIRLQADVLELKLKVLSMIGKDTKLQE